MINALPPIRIRSLCLSVLWVHILLAMCACGNNTPTATTTGSANLVFHDEMGELVAKAEVNLPDEFPDNDGAFTGTCVLIWSDSSFIPDAMDSGKYSAHIIGNTIYFDLNPGTADNNIMIRGTLEDTEIAGTWGRATDAGDTDMGEFVLTR